MTKTDHIAQITAALAMLDAADVERVADIVQSMTAPQKRVRALTARERELLEASKCDFAEGRTLTLDESRDRTDAVLARLLSQEQKSA